MPALQENEGGVALNAQAPNIILQKPRRRYYSIKNLQGNYVLLDFWHRGATLAEWKILNVVCHCIKNITTKDLKFFGVFRC